MATQVAGYVVLASDWNEMVNNFLAGALEAFTADGEVFVATGSKAGAAESGATLRTSLGLAIGTDVQAYDAQLADVAGLTPTDSNFIVGDGSNFVLENAATARASLGLNTRELLVPVTAEAAAFPYTTGLGDHQAATITSTGNVNFEFKVPADFTTLTSCVVVLIADATETIQWDVTASFGATGQDKSTHTDSITNATASATVDRFLEAAVSDALTAIAAGDHVGLQFESDTSDLQVLYLLLTYT